MNELRNPQRSQRAHTLAKGKHWHAVLLPRGRRRDYTYPGYKPPIRLGHYHRSKWGWQFYIFLPALPLVGAWRLCLSGWSPRDRDGARQRGDAKAAPVPQDRQARAVGIAQKDHQHD